MTNRTRTTITIHTQQRLVVHPLRDSVSAWCETCRDEVVALTPEFTVGVLRIAPGSLYDLLESGKWHAIQAGSESLLICSNSLSAASTENEILIEGENQ